MNEYRTIESIVLKLNTGAMCAAEATAQLKELFCLSRREELAKAAMQGILAGAPSQLTDKDKLAEDAYEVAFAMLREEDKYYLREEDKYYRE